MLESGLRYHSTPYFAKQQSIELEMESDLSRLNDFVDEQVQEPTVDFILSSCLLYYVAKSYQNKLRIHHLPAGSTYPTFATQNPEMSDTGSCLGLKRETK